MKKMRNLLKKCKSLSAALGRSSSYTTLASKSQDLASCGDDEVVVFVGSSRRRYTIQAKHLSHPVIRALVDSSAPNLEDAVSVKCEVVLFDHLLWMIEDGSLEAVGGGSSEELAALYAY